MGIIPSAAKTPCARPVLFFPSEVVAPNRAVGRVADKVAGLPQPLEEHYAQLAFVR